MLCDAIQDYFRTYLVLQRGYGANTLASYGDTFRLLLAWLTNEEGMDPSSMAASDLDSSLATSFLGWLEEGRGNSVSTRNTRLAHLKSYARHTMTASPEDSGACASIVRIPPKTAGTEPPDSLGLEETKALLTDPGTDTPRGLRDSALLSLLYDSGCRASELVGMDVSDVVTTPPCTAHVVGKGRKGRTIPLLPETGRLVASYVEAFGLAPDSPLFLNRQGKRLSRAGVAYTVRTHWSNVAKGNPEAADHETCHPHLLRHSKATHLVDEGVRVHYVRDFLGHESVTTTEVYFKSNQERLREEVERAAEGTVGKNVDYYTPEKRNELMGYLEALSKGGK